MGKKKHLNQSDLDKMSPEEVLAISSNQIEDGFDITHTNGVNPQLVNIKAEEDDLEDNDPDEEPVVTDSDQHPERTQEEVDEVSKPEPKESSEPERKEKTLEDNKGILFLRFFHKDTTNGKVLTRLKRKVYFPKDSSIEAGWYIATIIDERSNHGIMDVIHLDDVADSLWNPRYIKGIYVHRNHKDNQLEIYPAIPKDQLDSQQPVLIHTVQLPDPYKGNGNSIGEIIEAKRNQAETDKLG